MYTNAIRSRIDSGAFSDTVELACEFTGMQNVPIEDRTRLLTDNDKALLSREFSQYLETKVLVTYLPRLIIRKSQVRSKGITARLKSMCYYISGSYRRI